MNSGKKIIICLLFVSCAKKTDFDGDSLISSSRSESGRYLKCNVFADETFRGRVTIGSDEKGNYNFGCFDIDITESPESLFKTNSLFLQAYPLTVKRGKDEFDFGPPLELRIYDQESKTGPPVRVSKVIDRKSIRQKISEDSVDGFFDRYRIQVCNIDPGKWEGMQLVVYHEEEARRSKPIRVTKFLLPSFLSDPKEFGRVKEEKLVALHPFLNQNQESDQNRDEDPGGSVSDFARFFSSLCANEGS